MTFQLYGFVLLLSPRHKKISILIIYGSSKVTAVIAYERTTITFNNKSRIIYNASVINNCSTIGNNKEGVSNIAIVCHPVRETYITVVENGAVVDKGGKTSVERQHSAIIENNFAFIRKCVVVVYNKLLSRSNS